MRSAHWKWELAPHVVDDNLKGFDQLGIISDDSSPCCECAGETELAMRRPAVLKIDAADEEAAVEATLEAIAEDAPVDSFVHPQAAAQADDSSAAAPVPGCHSGGSNSSLEGSCEANRALQRGDSAQSLHYSWSKPREAEGAKGVSPASSSHSTDDAEHAAGTAAGSSEDMEPQADHEEASLLDHRDRKQRGREHKQTVPAWDPELGAVQQSALDEPWYRDRHVSHAFALQKSQAYLQT